MERSPFDHSASARERHERSRALPGGVITDEHGLMLMFRDAQDVETLLTDPRFSAVAMPILEFSGVTEGPLHELWSLLMFGKDGDDHQRIRRTVSAAFRTRAVQSHRPVVHGFVEGWADRLEQHGGETVDLWADFAVPVASRVACHVVGIPGADADQLGVWSIDLVHAFFIMDDQARTRAESAAQDMLDYLDAHLERLRSQPGDDVASSLLAARSAGGHDLGDDEIRALVANLVFGGLEATAKAITTGTYNLLVNDCWRRLGQRPEIITTAVAELLRFAPPVSTARLAPEDLEVCGVAMRAGQMAVLDADGPCRDPNRHDDPDRLDLERDPGRQLAFGAGAHYCLGAHLASVVLEEAFITLATRFPSMGLSEAGRQVEWDYATFNGITYLPVTVGR